MSSPFYERMLRDMADKADPVPLIEDIRIYTNWVLVKTHTWSLSTVFREMPGYESLPGMDTWMGEWLGKPALKSALELLSSRDTLRRAVGMACLKSLLPQPDNDVDGNSTGMFEAAAAHAPTCFIGHFKDGVRWREKGRPVSVVELMPRPGDIHWEDADEVLGRARIVLMTGLTLVNETLEDVIRRTPSALIRVVMGPTVPASPALFDYGIDMLGITVVRNMRGMADYARLGGGSIAYAPEGALRRVSMVKDYRELQNKLKTLIPRAARAPETGVALSS